MLPNTIIYISITSVFVLSIVYSLHYYSSKKDLIPQWVGFVWMACLFAYIVVILISFR